MRFALKPHLHPETKACQKVSRTLFAPDLRTDNHIHLLWQSSKDDDVERLSFFRAGDN